jgi:hypothetical protein
MLGEGQQGKWQKANGRLQMTNDSAGWNEWGGDFVIRHSSFTGCIQHR